MRFAKTLLQSLLVVLLFQSSMLYMCAKESTTEQLTEDLFTSQTPQEFHQSLDLATQANVPQQVILEARFLFYVDQADNHALAQLSQELLPLENAFNPQISQIFTLEDDWKAIVKYTTALNNLEKGNTQAFEKNIKEAFWLSPRQASAFAPHVEQFKLDVAMQSVTINPTTTQQCLLDGKMTPLLQSSADINILFFWSPWSREFNETVDDFKDLCEVAKKSKIVIRTLVAEQSDEVNQDAIRFITESKLAESAIWLKEDDTLHLSTTLRIQSIPTVVIINKEGKVQFNGHPSSLTFWSTLKKYAPNIKRPNSSIK